MDFKLTEREIKDIERALDEDTLKGKIRRKLLALKMRDAGAPLEMIASSLSVSTRTVSNYIAEFREGGLSATVEDRAYTPESSLEPYLGELEKSFREKTGRLRQAGASPYRQAHWAHTLTEPSAQCDAQHGNALSQGQADPRQGGRTEADGLPREGAAPKARRGRSG
jgi:transposase